MEFSKIVKRIEFTILALILVLGVIFSLTTAKFLSRDNLTNIMYQLSSLIISAIGMTMVIITGGIDVSIGSTLGLSAVVAGMLLTNNTSLLLVILAVLGVGGLVGAINGVIIGYGGIPAIISTLGTMNLVRAFLFQVLKGRWITGLPESVRFIGIGRFLGLPISIWIAIVLLAAFSYFLRFRPSGRYIYAIGNNIEAARISGVNPNKIQFIVYFFAGILAGFCGLIYTARTGIVQTNTGMGFEMDVIAAVVLGGTSTMGGRGTILGTLLGAVLVGIIKNGMVLLNVPALGEGLVIGLLILISVIIDIIRSQGD